MLLKKAIKLTSQVLFFGFILASARQGEVKAAEQSDAIKLLMEGSKLSQKEVKNLEDQLKANPKDLSSRTELLGYYFQKQFESGHFRQARQTHILWIIQNRPESEVAGLPQVQLNPLLDGETYDKAKSLWLEQTKIRDKDLTILGNAANFFLLSDGNLAEELLKKAQSLDPDNPEWSERLGHLYALKMRRKSPDLKREEAVNSLRQMENALDKTTKVVERFYLLTDLAKMAYESDDTGKARTYAEELLKIATDFRMDWNYGNAIHQGNLVLGRLALKNGHLGKAEDYLIEAGKTPGSPQLNSFGPNMTLAKELLERGEKDVVLKYFKLCGIFWEMGKDDLAEWSSIVKTGGIPDFGANLEY